MEFVEVRGKSVEVAVKAAMQELQVSDVERLDVEVVQEPERAVFGLFGGRDAVVKVTLRPEQLRRKRRRRKGGRDHDGAEGGGDRPGGGNQDRGGQGGSDDRGGRQRDQRPPRTDQRSAQQPPAGKTRGEQGSESGTRNQQRSRRQATPDREERNVSIEEQVPVVEAFLTGLVDAFGLEGSVAVHTESDVIIADINGGQTEAMVGPRGSVIESIHELAKTVLHRQTQSSARLRLDIAGYGDKRRQALAIYANQLIGQVIEDGGEVMLEPMSAADRKVIHDAAGERPEVRSYSEGEAPQRYVVLARVAGVAAAASEEE